jgi:uncharacterized membrane protein
VYTTVLVLHVLAAAVWVGGVVALTFAAIPVIRRLPPAERGPAMKAVGRRWRPIGWSSLAVLALTGLELARRWNAFDPDVFLSWERPGSLILAKLVLGAAVIALAAVHDYWLGPLLARQIREGGEQTARPPLVAVGRASLAFTLALPVLGVLIGR